MSEESLKNKTIKGISWSAADAFVGHGITFVVGIVLARLLTPAEYGLIGICMIFITILNGIVDSGFSTAIIRKKTVTKDDYNTMFITNLAISVILAIILCLFAPWISFFFKREELTSLIRVMSILLVINAFSLTQITILTRNVDFKTRTKASLISAVLSGFAGILFAFLGFGVWALVLQQILKQLLNTICLWFYNKWHPSLSFSKDSFYYMWGFGSKLMISGLLENIWNQAYQIVVGKFYSPTTLGQYTKAREFANIFSTNINSIVMRVSYPVLSSIQDDYTRMKNVYQKIIKITMFVTTMLLIPLAAVSEPLIYCLIGPKWQEASTYLPLICIIMSFYPLQAINLNMLKVLGRSDIFLYIEIIKKIIAIAPLLIGIYYNIYWMLIVSIITTIISFFLNSWYSGNKIGYTSFKQLMDIIPNYFLACLIAISVYFFKYLNLPHFTILLLQLFVGSLVFFFIVNIFNIQEYIEIKRIVRDFIAKKSN